MTARWESGEGCSSIVDGACRAKYSDAAYHRIIDCLLPMYASLRLVQRAGAADCLLLQPAAMLPLLPLIVPAAAAKAGSSRTQLRLVNASRATALLRSSATRLAIARRTPPDPLTTRLLHAHITAELGVGGEARRPAAVVLLVRWPPRAMRDWRGVAHRLSVATARAVRPYHGHESLLETVRLFAGARVVVGYHGAGLVNTVFMPHRACVVEVSTYMAPEEGGAEQQLQLPATGPTNLTKHVGHYIDLAGSKWRTNEPGIAPWNPKLTWTVYRLPLAQVLRANNVTRWAWRRYPDALKFLPWVGLEPHDVDNVAAIGASCARQAEGTESAVLTRV